MSFDINHFLPLSQYFPSSISGFNVFQRPFLRLFQKALDILFPSFIQQMYNWFKRDNTSASQITKKGSLQKMWKLAHGFSLISVTQTNWSVPNKKCLVSLPRYLSAQFRSINNYSKNIWSWLKLYVSCKGLNIYENVMRLYVNVVWTLIRTKSLSLPRFLV